MTQEALTPAQLMAKVEKTVEGTAAELRELLHQAASQLEPFPYFYGSHTIQAVEAEPPQGQGQERGCVVVCPDGELYELTVNFSPSQFGFSSSIEREEKVKKLDLPPLEYIPYAYNALTELAKLLSKGRSV